jgi:hypothetical protein
MKQILLLVVFSTTYCVAEGTYYKWTDDEGIIHYSATKSEKDNSSEITVHTSKPTAISANNNKEEQVDRKKETSIQLKKYAAQDEKRRVREDQRKRRCREAKKSMKNLKDSFKPYFIDPKSGGHIYPSSRTASKIKAHKQERIRKKQLQVNTACKKWA